MLNRLFRKRDPVVTSAPKVRADPDFDVEGDKLIARAVCIYWMQGGAERKFALRRNLRPLEPLVTRGVQGFGVALHKDGAVDKVVAQELDFATASDLHRILWNWLGQLCQNGHDPFPIRLTPPPGGFAHDIWPEAKR